MSQIKVDSIIPRGGIPSGSNGGVIQVKHGFCNVFSSTSTSYVDTGLSVTITPSSSSSKFIIVINGIGSVNVNDSAQGVFRLVRDSTTVANQKVIADTNNQNGEAFAVVEGNRDRYPVTTSLIDSPNTTNNITYKVRLASPQGQTAYLGRWGVDNNWSVNTYMTIYEVSG